DNQHKKIQGYRDLTAEDIAVINELKRRETELREFLNSIETSTRQSCRWMSVAKTNLETGFMYAIKAVAQPDGTLGSDN
ncbi:Acb2/Tad1 domain-containing protein, partial [Acinetobacter baumannii]|uniref:Acb2/Tad1 domain-containing protein n=1 Tax=Acinetobacter baumannii TaxID=470 RepID=UPI00148F199E